MLQTVHPIRLTNCRAITTRSSPLSHNQFAVMSSSVQCLRSKLAFLRPPCVSNLLSTASLQSLSIRPRSIRLRKAASHPHRLSFTTSATSHTASAAQAASISFRLPSIMLFDKVPDKLPDWWDDDEDDSEKIDGGGNGDGDDDDGGNGGDDGKGGNGGDDDPNNIFGLLLAMYSRSLVRYPIRTKAFSTLVLAVIGDYCAQRIAQRESDTFSLDRRRSISIGIWAFTFMGPVLHFWYATLDRMFVGRYAVIYKLLCDQLMFAPFFNSSFLAGTGTLEGKPLDEVAHAVTSKFWASMKANWMLWPAAQFVNFTFVPSAYQVLYVNGIALIWNIILTYISHE